MGKQQTVPEEVGLRSDCSQDTVRCFQLTSMVSQVLIEGRKTLARFQEGRYEGACDVSNTVPRARLAAKVFRKQNNTCIIRSSTHLVYSSCERFRLNEANQFESYCLIIIRPFVNICISSASAWIVFCFLYPMYN